MQSRIQRHKNKSNNEIFGRIVLIIVGIILTTLIIIDNAHHAEMGYPVMTTEHALITSVVGGVLLLLFQFGMLEFDNRSQLVASVNSIARHLSNKFVLWILAYIFIALCFLIYPVTLFALIAFLAIVIFYVFYPNSVSITINTFAYDWKHMEYLRQHKFNGFGGIFKVVGIGMLVILCISLLSAVFSFMGTVVVYGAGALFIVALIIFAFIFILGNF